MAQERRRRKRLRANLFASLSRPATNQEVGRGVVVDVSRSGFGIETDEPIPFNEELMCHIEIPFQVRAIAVRVITEGQRKRYGLQLVGQSWFEKLVFRHLLKGPLRTKKVV